MPSALALASGIATLVLLVGVQDLESYDHAFFSLNRGTAVDPVRVLGQPVFTAALGIGVRLPLHGSLGASPAAVLAPYLPAPITYWLLITLSIGAAIAVVRCALQPLAGRRVSWLAAALLFCSVPIVNYTIFDDWPETAVTFCAVVACVFAPHALLAVYRSSAASRRWTRHLLGLSVAGLVWGLVGLAHPGYWPLLAVTIVFALVLFLIRSEFPMRARLIVSIVLAAVSFMAVAPQVPDILREMSAAASREPGTLRRIVGGAEGSLVSANLFPFQRGGARDPFTFLMLALLSAAIGLTSHGAERRRLIVGSALVSVLLGIAAATMTPGTSMFAPSNTWALRDPATAFAMLSAAAAAGALRRGGDHHRAVVRAATVALLVAGLQGPAYAVHLVATDLWQAADRSPWTHDFSSPDERVSRRGVPRDRILPGARLALWPGVADGMRNGRRPSVDFADAGYLLTTVWTKQRTTRGFLEPNDLLFNQHTEFGPETLCDHSAIQFLQLRYLVMPPDVECTPWSRLPGALVDERLHVGVPNQRDDRVRALPVARLTEPIAREPAFSPNFRLGSSLVPLPGTTLQLTTRGATLRLDSVSLAADRALVLPIAYDSALRASSGRIRSVGGLAALVGVAQPRVTVEFVPDAPSLLRAVSMAMSQLLMVVGLLGLGSARPR